MPQTIETVDSSIKIITKNFCPPEEVSSLSTIAQNIIAYPRFEKVLQFSITSRNGEDVFEGTGALYDYEKDEFTTTTDQFVTLNAFFKNSEFEKVLNKVQTTADKFGVKIGRSRWMRLNPKTCLSLHCDPEEFRFHIPIKTNNKCFFVVDDQCYRMPDVGSLYILQSTKLHTAINASFETRDHLVFDTYK